MLACQNILIILKKQLVTAADFFRFGVTELSIFPVTEFFNLHLFSWPSWIFREFLCVSIARTPYISLNANYCHSALFRCDCAFFSSESHSFPCSVSNYYQLNIFSASSVATFFCSCNVTVDSNSLEIFRICVRKSVTKRNAKEISFRCLKKKKKAKFDFVSKTEN